MAETHHKKQQITAALTDIRIQVQNEVAKLRRTLDMKQVILQSIKNHPWEWASCAAIFGWVLSRLPRVKRGSIFRAQIKSRSKIVPVDHSASCGEKFGKSPNP
jgi:hypothetical protein